MQNTIKSVFYSVIDKLCKTPIQDFGTAAAVREVQRLIDPKGTKKLTPTQVKTVKAFLKILIKTA
jgi:hypothetical protein